ncbi:MAG TPA: pyridoxal-phosphate dependent enzyme [Thermomicrobiales bacterium]|nr:pyridoxal-phosphate dependent enzyme [Thermomicrobiales bacterium]
MSLSILPTPGDCHCLTLPARDERLTRLDRLAVVSAIGNTSLLPLRQLAARHGLPTNVELWLKAEWENPGGSVKDRPALAIIRDALERNALAGGKVLLDATSGNTGIAYAMLGAALDIPVELVVAGSVSDERKRILAAYGATVIFSDPYDGSNGAIRAARARAAEHPERYFYADQYNNRANLAAHESTTGPELWRQTGGMITHLVAGLGTTGTLVGSGRALKRHNPHIQLVGVQPAEAFHGIEGLKHLPTAIIPGIYDPSVPDRQIGVQTEEAFELARELAHVEGFFAGASTGAALAGAMTVASELAASGQSGRIVAIAPDGGMKYLSSGLWSTG